MKCWTASHVALAFFIAQILLGVCPSVEAQSPVTQSAVEGQTWDYVVLGSSIGTWWSKNYGRLLESSLSVRIVYHDYAVGEQTIANLLSNVMSKERIREAIRGAQVITIGCGFQDTSAAIIDAVYFGPYDPKRLDQKVKDFQVAYDSMIDEVLKLASPSRTMIRLMDFYCPFVRVYKEHATYDVIKQYWMKFNDCIIQAGRRAGIPVAQVFAAFNGPDGNDDPVVKGYIAGDGKHPSDLGKDAIAAEFCKLGYECARP